jgi:hypothetical protein
MRKVRILLISPPALSQLIEHLFRDRNGLEVVGRVDGLDGAAEARRLLPELIVANVKPVRTSIGPAVSSIKRSSPLSKLILVCSVSDFISGARRWGADACLNQEQLVHRLVPTALALSGHRKSLRIR